MIELHKIGGKYEVYQRNEFIGTLETYSNPHHLTNCYIKLNLIRLDSSISMELFTRLRAVVGKPIQAMLDSTEISPIEFLTAAGFTCKRKCYEVEATAHDFISDNGDMRISECIVGDLEYEECCRMVYRHYAETHQSVNPLTSDFASFIMGLPKKVIYTRQGNQIMNVAFVEDNEIAYVCGVEEAHFAHFARSLVSFMLSEHDTVFFEADDCDWAAMALRALFKNLDDVSYDTYILGDEL